MSDPPRFVISAPRPVRKGSLVGFIDIAMPSGMILHGYPVFISNCRTWVLPPSKQIVGRDGTVQRTPEGKIRYQPTVSFVNRTTQERWSDAVLRVLDLSLFDGAGSSC